MKLNSISVCLDTLKIMITMSPPPLICHEGIHFFFRKRKKRENYKTECGIPMETIKIDMNNGRQNTISFFNSQLN